MPAINLDEIFAITIRPVTPDDLGYVISTFERSLRPEFLDANNTDFGHSIRAKINRLLYADGNILIATPPEDTNRILGWVFYDSTAVHYCYVRSTHRLTGIARRLLTRAGHNTKPLVVTSITKDARTISITKHPIRYLPPL